MNVANNCAVSIHYTLKNDAGEVLDSSIGGEPLIYLQGHQNIVPGLENALEGGAKLATRWKWLSRQLRATVSEIRG